ncbi:MAG TPA: hypothetical protein VGI63_03135 [Verrucomicrobiae bacterium]|jgi:hypothetical protein
MNPKTKGTAMNFKSCSTGIALGLLLLAGATGGCAGQTQTPADVAPARRTIPDDDHPLPAYTSPTNDAAKPQ